MKGSAHAFSLGIVVALLACVPVHAQVSDGANVANDPQDRFVELADHLVDSTNTWLRWYGALPGAWKRYLESAAVRIASLRRSALEHLIVHSPELALENRLGQVDRATLPPKVVALLEIIVDDIGDYQAPAYLHTIDAQTGAVTHSLQSAFLELGDKRYPEPKLYGRRVGQPSKIALPVHGIAIDDAFAWLEEPFRFLDAAELEQIQLPPDATAIFSGGKVLLIESAKDFESIRDSLRRREDVPGPFLPDGVIDDLVVRAWTHGPKNILWIPVDFDEAPGSPFEESPATDAVIADADAWIRAASRDLTSVSVTYLPGVLRLPAGSLERARGLLPGWPFTLIDDTKSALAEFDRMNGDTGRWLPESFDRLAIVAGAAVTSEDDSVRGGAFTRNDKDMVFYGEGDEISINHELGHTYLFGHSFYHLTGTSDPLGPLIGVLPIPYDYMGTALGSLSGWHINHPPSSAKTNAFWMDGTEICTAATDPLPEVCDARLGGSFRLVAHDNGPDGLLRALKIPTADRTYWVSMRRLWPLQYWVNNGVQIHYTPPEPNRIFRGGDGLQGATYVGLRGAGLDPPRESPFLAGEMLEDAARGVRVRIDATGEEAGVPFADVTVERF